MSTVTNPTDPDHYLHADLPPAILAAQQRARQDAHDLQKWRAHDLKWQVFHRLWRMNVNHAAQAWQHRYRNPLAPYALAYLFTQPTEVTTVNSQNTTVLAATRLWKAGPESQQPLPLLSALTSQARSRDPRMPWDLRQEIANRSDDGMADDAVYLGLGLSSLDTHTGTWAQVCQHTTVERDIPGTILCLSTGSADPTDQQVIVADRRGVADRNNVTIHAHAALDRYYGASSYPFADRDLQTLYEQFGFESLLRAMRELDLVLKQADHQRRTMRPGRDHRRRPS